MFSFFFSLIMFCWSLSLYLLIHHVLFLFLLLLLDCYLQRLINVTDVDAVYSSPQPYSVCKFADSKNSFPPCCVKTLCIFSLSCANDYVTTIVWTLALDCQGEVSSGDYTSGERPPSVTPSPGGRKHHSLPSSLQRLVSGSCGDSHVARPHTPSCGQMLLLRIEGEVVL